MFVINRSIPVLMSFMLISFAFSCSEDEQPVDGGQEPAVDGDGGAGDEISADGDGGGCMDVYPGQVLITEIMLNPQAAPGVQGRFFELYNNGMDPLRMEGWILNDGAGGEADLSLAQGETFESQAFLVVAFVQSPDLNGGLQPDLIITDIDLESRLLFIVAGDVEVDRVDFSGQGWPQTTGMSMNLDSTKFDLILNDYPQNWCAATEVYGQGDHGTPGGANTECIEPVACEEQVDGYPCDNLGGSTGDYCKDGACVEPVCGDGVRGPLEQCDDNNTESGDGCSSACELESCGDGKLDAGELCDDGQNGDDLDGCRDSCLYTCLYADLDCEDTTGDCSGPVCQSNDLGQICGLELDQLDPPDDFDPCTDDQCDSQGNPLHEPAADGTACDNQTGLEWDYCVNGECLDPVCGDSIQGPMEQCDDGADGDDLDGCRDNCFFTCQHAATDCGDTPGDCYSPMCVDNSAGRVCEIAMDLTDVPDQDNPCMDGQCDAEGNPSSTALPDGTGCNNLSGDPGDYCVTGACIDPVCGDGIRGPLEQCDQGLNNSDEIPDACRTDCRMAHCGDNVIDTGEVCDDANFDSCDGCLHNCTVHSNACGDGIVCPPETCDDENDVPGDGCSADCQREAGVCPDDMLTITADVELGVPVDVCMDRYEASRPDATSDLMGVDITRAVSRPGVQPWYTNPMNADQFQLFQGACQASGKRICSKEEYFAACTGPDRYTYVYGNVFDRETCNCVDTFCDDHCADNGIPPEDCNTNPNCGYTYYCFHVEPTGSFPGCTNSLDTRDLTGNLWEIVPTGPPTNDPRGYEVRGGAFNCGGAITRLQCSFNAGWDALFAGFRCCRDM